MQKVLDQSFPAEQEALLKCAIGAGKGWRLVGPVESCRPISYYEDDYGIFSSLVDSDINEAVDRGL